MNTKNEKTKRCLYVLICCILLFSITCHSNPGLIRIDLTNDNLRTSAEFDPSGLIALWSGSLDTIPDGWKLCDGSEDTLNTSNRFVYSTDNMEEPGTIGGSSSHKHSYYRYPYHTHGFTNSTPTPHTHDYPLPSELYEVSGSSYGGIILNSMIGTGFHSASHSHTVELTGEAYCYTSEEEDFIPPYYEMMFIKKETNDPIIPIGLIVMWTGSINNIPTGWDICNGSNGTPDLQERFIRGILPGEDPGKIGGTLAHNHTYTDVPRHTHSLSTGGVSHNHGYYGSTSGFDYNSVTGPYVFTYYSGYTDIASVPHTHEISEVGIENCTTQNATNLPPYFKVAFIMNTEVANSLPLGVISMWGDSIANIPSGWNQCNGTSNTPNMLNRFPRGILTGEQPGIIGGSATHFHVYTELPLHTHTVLMNPMIHQHSMNRISGLVRAQVNTGYPPQYISSGIPNYATTQSSPSHNHYVNPIGYSSCYTSYENSLPPHVKLIYIQKALSISNPSPEDGATGISQNPILSLNVNYLKGDDLLITFYNASDDSIIDTDIIFGGSGIASVTWSGLSSGTSYYWNVKTNDSLSGVPSDTWSFTTNYVPNKPTNPTPNDGLIDINYSPTLSVDVFDNDGNDLIISFYNASDDSIIDTDTASGGSGTASVVWSGLSPGTVYSWYAISDDGLNVNQSATWSFTTNHMPDKPINPIPIDGATGLSYNPTISVDVFDVDGDDITTTFYDAFDDSIIDTDIVFGGSGTALVTWSGLSPGTAYSWYTIADDGLSTNQSATWSFTTDNIPNEPANPSPNDGATDIGYDPVLSVEVYDDEGDDLKVIFYNGSDDSIIDMDTVFGGSGTASIVWSGLSPGTVYSWYATADDGLSITQSYTWSFTTNYMPDRPTNPNPNDGDPNIDYITLLSVDVSDVDGDDITTTFYDAFDDSIIDTDIIFGGSGTALVTWSGLSPGTAYSWYTIADDGLSMNQSVTWSFITNYAPNEPINPSPNDGDTNISYNPTLSVDVSDIDGDDLTIEFYDASDDSVIGSDTVLGGSGSASASWLGLLPGTVYSWYTIADDGLSTTQSATWSFITNYAPNEPINPSPNNGATDASYNPTLSVDVYDNDGDDLIITFYDDSDDSIIDTDIIYGGSGTALIVWSGLSPETTYSWYATADDGLSTNQSSTWSFTTVHIPNEPTNPSPADGALDVSYNPTLSVDVSDDDGDDLSIKFYDASDDSIIDTDMIYGGSGTASVTWSGLSPGATYSWYATADDGPSITQSYTWSFTTNHVPNEPTNPSPSDGAIDVENIITLLSVDVSDNDGDDLTITFYNSSDDSAIDSDVVSGGSGTASVNWSILFPETNYSWYVIADDGLSTTQSSTWIFTTAEEIKIPPGIPGFGLIFPIIIGTVAMISIKVFLKRKRRY